MCSHDMHDCIIVCIMMYCFNVFILGIICLFHFWFIIRIIILCSICITYGFYCTSLSPPSLSFSPLSLLLPSLSLSPLFTAVQYFGSSIIYFMVCCIPTFTHRLCLTGGYHYHHNLTTLFSELHDITIITSSCCLSPFNN